jgi:Flp pilus assembly protein TadG
MSRQHRWHAQGLDLLVLGIGLVTTASLLFMGLVDLDHAFMAKQHILQAVERASRQAMTAAIADPNLAEGQADLNPAVSQSTFTQVLAQDLGWPPGTYTVQDVELVTTGQTLPGNLIGTATGPGLYVQVQFSLSILPFGNPAQPSTTVPITVEVETSAVRYNQPQVQWATS